MNAQQLNTNDILADLEAFYADPPATLTLTLEEQAEIYCLLWEVHGIVAIAEQTRQSPNTANGLRRLRSIAGELLGLLGGSDDALDLAREMVDAMPAGGRKQALVMHLEQRFLSRREMGAGHGD